MKLEDDNVNILLRTMGKNIRWYMTFKMSLNDNSFEIYISIFSTCIAEITDHSIGKKVVKNGASYEGFRTPIDF